MPHPGWKSQRADVPPKRNTGHHNIDADSNAHVHNETVRRPPEFEEQAAQQIVAAGGGGGAAPAGVRKPDEAPATSPEIRDWHKTSFYVDVGHDHPASNPDDDHAPGYALAGRASTIADGYAKAAAIAAAEGVRCALQIDGSGGPWKEGLHFTNAGVDVVGRGVYPPIIQGFSTVDPSITDLNVRNVHFRSQDAHEALRLPPSPFSYPATPNAGLNFTDCLFSGARIGLYAQRPFFADRSTFWSWQEYDPAAVVLGHEYAPLVCEIDEPQTYFTWLRHCRMEAARSQTLGGARGPFNGIQSIPQGYAIRASARRDCLNDGPWIQQMFSSNGTLRTAVNVDTGQGEIATGLILDHCDVQGSTLCEGWFVSHLHCTVRGGIPDVTEWLDTLHFGNPVPPFNAMVYAVLRGHDWILNIVERQFAMVQFDDTPVPSGYIARSEDDPIKRVNAFPGGTAVWYRTGAHLPFNPSIPDSAPGLAHIARGAVDTFLTTRASTSAQNWTSGTLISADGPNINPKIAFHPLSG